MASLFVCEILQRLEIAKSESGTVDPTAQESSLLCDQMDSDVMKWNRQGRKKMVRNPATLLCLDLSLRPLSC